VLERWGGRTRLLLEIKAHGRNRKGSRDQELAERTAALLAQLPAADYANIRVLSFSQRVLETVAESLHTRDLLPPLLVRNLSHPGEMRKTTAAKLARCHVCCINIDSFSRSEVERVHRLEMPLYAYTVDTKKQVRHAKELGCSLLICNDPKKVRELVLELG